MSNHDAQVEEMLKRAMASGDGAVDLSQATQQVPVIPGIPTNGGWITIHEIKDMEELQFREFVLAVLVGMMGAQYAAPPAPTSESADTDEDADPESADNPFGLDNDPED